MCNIDDTCFETWDFHTNLELKLSDVKFINKIKFYYVI